MPSVQGRPAEAQVTLLIAGGCLLKEPALDVTTESARDTAQVRGQPPLCRANLFGGFIGPFSSLLETRHCEMGS